MYPHMLINRSLALCFTGQVEGAIDPYLQLQSGEVVAEGQQGYTHLPSEAVNYNQVAATGAAAS